jgi:hypothetical protein
VKIKIIKAPVGSEPFVVEIDNGLDAMQAQVGGLIEVVRVDGLDLICNEEGLLLSLPYNRTVGGHRIHGDFFLSRHDEDGEAVSVTTDDIKRFVR